MNHPIAVFSVVALLSMTPAQTGQPPRKASHILVKDDTGTTRGGLEPRQAKPSVPVSSLTGNIAVFFSQRTLKDSRGRVVSGLCVAAWKDGPAVHVEVYTIVPRPGSPNVYLADRRDQINSMSLAPLASFSLQRGESRSLTELKVLGVAPYFVTLEK